MPKEGQTGRLKDGTRVIFLDGAVRKVNEGGMAQMGGGYYESPQGRKFREGPKGGFQQVGGPTQTQVDSYSTKSTKINESLGSLDALDKKLRATETIGPFGWLKNPNDLSELEGLNKDLLLRLKEQPYNLGVLNGPDLQIMEEVLGNPAKLKDAAFRKGFEARLRNVAASLGRTHRNDVQSYGAIGGRPSAIPNLFRSPDSTYTPEEWGQRGLVPPNRYGKTGAKGAGGPGRPAAKPAARAAPKAKYLGTED
jgi:hypothetical protein